MRTTAAIFLRTLAIAGVIPLVGWLASLGQAGGAGANIGAGLLSFLAIIVAAAIWSFFDARGSGRLAKTLVLWLVVAVLVGISAAFGAQGFATQLDAKVLLSDLSSLSFFVAGLVALPALLGASIGASVGRPARRLGQTSS